MKTLAFLLALLPSLASAQGSSPNWPTGYQPSMAEWNAAFASKLDVGVSVSLPVWTTATRPPSPTIGLTGYNTTLGALESWNGTIWGPVPPAASTSPYLNASSFNVPTDGTTSADAAMLAAVAACRATGTTLLLPPGKILMTGAVGTIPLVNCKLQGAGFPGITHSATPSAATTFIITNPTTAVFTGGALNNNTGGSGFAMEGFGAYWPNQTGNTAYPPFFTDLGVAQVNSAYIHNVALINCYQCFYQAANSDWANWDISDSTFYAVMDAFNLYSTCDSWRMNNVHFTHGNWVQAATGSIWGYLNTAAQQNSMVHVRTPTSGCNVSILMSNISAFAWRYGIQVDDGAGFVGSPITGSGWDGTATFLKLNGTGTAFGTTFSGTGFVSCLIHFPDLSCSSGASSAPPAFDLGSHSNTAPYIKDFSIGNGFGDFIKSDGASVIVSNVDASFGKHNNGSTDTTDYYCIHATAAVGMSIKNLRCGPQGTTGTKMHGIVADVAGNGAIIVGFETAGTNEGVSIPTGSNTTQLIASNISNTQGSLSTIFSGTGAAGVIYGMNVVDKPNKGAVTACGTSPSISGVVQGIIQVGGGGPITSCTYTQPFMPSGSYSCTFTPRAAGYINAVATGAPPQWVITSGVDMQNLQIYYNCQGSQ